MSVHLGWEVQRNRVLIGFWTSPCLLLVLSEMRNCGEECPKCPNCISFTCHRIYFSGHVQLPFFFFFFLIICLPLTPTVSHDSWDDFCSHISWYFHFKGKVLTTSLTTIHLIIRISISSHGAAILSLAHPISCFSFVYTFMNDLNSAVQTPQDSTASSDVFRDQKKLVLHVSPKCWCLVPQMLLCSAFRWT